LKYSKGAKLNTLYLSMFVLIKTGLWECRNADGGWEHCQTDTLGPIGENQHAADRQKQKQP